MPDISGFFIFLTISIIMYIAGYYDKEQVKELKLYNSIKFLYGKRGKPIYTRGGFTQTLGLILGFSSFLQFFALKQEIPMFLNARGIFAISFLFLGIVVLLDELLDRIRRM